MCGGKPFSVLADVFMALFEVSEHEVSVLLPSQFVKSVGIGGREPAALKELLVGPGLSLQEGEDSLTLDLDNLVLEEVIAELREDVDLNTLNLANLDLSPYQLALSGGSGSEPFFPILNGTTIRALQGDGDISLSAYPGLLVLSASTRSPG